MRASVGILMFSNPQQGMEAGEVARLRQEGGRWLRARREELGLTQRDLALAIGADYYSFISQIESGRGRVPINQMEAWASALRMSRREFAKGIMRYYDPLTYSMLFDGEEEKVEADAAGPTSGLGDLVKRISRLEARLAKNGP